MKKILFIAALVSCLFTWVSESKADLIIDISDVVLASGGSGFVDVFISSDGLDNVETFQYKFAITDGGTPIGDLRFTNPQSNSEVSLSNYILFGDSDGFTSVPQNSPAFDELLGGDFSFSFAGTNVGATPFLLARLDIEHVLPTGTPPEAAAGDTFTISLIQDPDTFFNDEFTDPVTIGSTSLGTVTFSATVPEPSSFWMMSTGLLLVLRRRRQKRANLRV